MANASRNGFEVIMASADGDHLIEAKKIEQVRHKTLALKRDISIFSDLKALFQTIRFFLKEKPDIVHTHTPKAGLIGMLAAKLCRVPLRIHTVAGMPLVGLTGLKRSIVIFTEKLTYWAANHVWPNSYGLMDFILENRFTKPAKLKIIGEGSSNGINLSEFSEESFSEKISEQVKRDIGYSSDYKYMCFVGRIVSQKGIVELVSVFKQLQNKYTNWKLLLVGPFENDRDPVSAECVNEINSNPDIISTGYSDKVKYILKNADLCVFPSHREGFPNVPLQAGVLKCPIVCSEIVGNVEVVKHMNTGLLHEAKNELALYEQLDYAMNNPIKMQELAENNYKRIIEKFDRHFVQAEILRTYNKLLNELNK